MRTFCTTLTMRSSPIPVSTPGAGSGSEIHFGEPPIAQIPVEPVGSLQAAKVKVRPAIAVDVADGDSGAIMGHEIRRVEIALKLVGERDTRGLGIHQGEPRASGGLRLDLAREGFGARGLRLGDGSLPAEAQQYHRGGRSTTGPDHGRFAGRCYFLSR